MQSKIRIFIIGSLIVLGVVTGWIIPSSVAAFEVSSNFSWAHQPWSLGAQI